MLRAGLEYGQEVHQPMKNSNPIQGYLRPRLVWHTRWEERGGVCNKKEHLKSEFSGQVSPLWV